ncbi:restriction endonuclease [Tissierella sp. P1]|uniref:HpaII family restriction endonuclease n=1 Tax=Tissierella sp. P1 TaxID=1280483 RepID=UPI000BA0E62A|nr:HpaII family restriction endonuclease [Tissierella sp. P1]OZV13543.1 restriction endonuclease [Tissierella sp. P1]
MLTGNKGEWSEVYTFFKLMAEGRLYAADADLNKIESIYYPIIKILRNQLDNNLEYIRNGVIRLVNGTTGEEVLNIEVAEFAENANVLLNRIRNSTGAFSVPDIQDFLDKINCDKLKASSSDKSDITIVVHDFNTGMNPELRFSIKSRLGNPSTLLNASSATNFIYKIKGTLTDEEISMINSLSSHSKIRDRLLKIEEKGCTFEFLKVEKEIFNLNMQLIDSNLPIIISHILLYYYKGVANKLSELIDIVQAANPCNYQLEYNHSFYHYKFKAFITDIALGMTPASVWNGVYDANGGYIVVKENGDVLCYHIYNRNEFQDYLIKNTKLETPSSTRHKFGEIYKVNDELYFKLNLQIRFIN